MGTQLTRAEPPLQFSAHVHCGQTAGWINMALGIEVVQKRATKCVKGMKGKKYSERLHILGLNSTQLNEHLWTQVIKHLNVHIYLVTISYRY